MNLRSVYPYFLLKNGYLHSYPSLSENLKTEVVIIGAGISGTLTGYYLINSGVDVVIVDKRHPGSGSTCASTSMLQYEIDTGLAELAEKKGMPDAAACYFLCLDAIYALKHLAEKLAIKNDFETRESVYVASGKKDVNGLKKEFEARKKIGIRLDYLGQKDIKAKFGFDAPAALLSYDAGQMDSFCFTHGLLQEIKKKGGRIYGQTEIKKMKNEKGGMMLTTADGNIITSKKCVFANGYEAFQYITPPLTMLSSTYAVVSEPIPDHQINYLLWETARPYFYMRGTSDCRIIIGGEDEKFYNPEKRDKLIKKKSKKLIKSFNEKFPSILFRPDFEWAGTFATTKDGLPFIGVHKKYLNAFFALGFGGNGITFSLIAAEIIHDLFHKVKNKHAALFSFERNI